MENSTSEALTSIHDAYTLSATQDSSEIVINQFLQTLAEVAISIAARKINLQIKEVGNESSRLS